MCSYALERGGRFFDQRDAYGNGGRRNCWEVAAGAGPGEGRDRFEVGTTGTAIRGRRGRTGNGSRFFAGVYEDGAGAVAGAVGVEMIDLYMAHNIKLPQFRDDLFAELDKVKDGGRSGRGA